MTLVFATIVLVSLTSLLYLTQASRVAATGYDISAAQEQRDRLERQQQLLLIQEARLQALLPGGERGHRPAADGARPAPGLRPRPGPPRRTWTGPWSGPWPPREHRPAELAGATGGLALPAWRRLGAARPMAVAVAASTLRGRSAAGASLAPRLRLRPAVPSAPSA